ncbi:hypothetical protein [Xanthocytophaga flava]|uniref:hypothetical protein n=1 Tax=Xanthocytophaga flava TaxID=3048013 RepID=UPI0028D3FA41|nr:hypothetical protein [Xanthocytophaga flavus]MDJ1467463.1 hypothetical protein [Xanthocytophaga flavus]
METIAEQSILFFNGLTENVVAENEKQLMILKEIQLLEQKIEEVTNILCKATLSYMVRFQLKDDLEYYNEMIERKRQQLHSQSI